MSKNNAPPAFDALERFLNNSPTPTPTPSTSTSLSTTPAFVAVEGEHVAIAILLFIFVTIFLYFILSSLSLFTFLASLQAALVYRPFLYVTKSYQQRHFLSLIFTNVFPTFPHLSLSLESFLAWTSRSSDKVAASPPLLIESLAITRWHHFGLWGKLEYVSLLLLLLLPRRRRPISFRKPLTSTESLRQAHELSLLSAKLNIL